MSSSTVRPTKKQTELLKFIEEFIKEHGYSPSYREIMAGLQYTSVATVALHVNNLIRRGHLRKRGNAARSLEVVKSDSPSAINTGSIERTHEKWLEDKILQKFSIIHKKESATEDDMKDLHTLIEALSILHMRNTVTELTEQLNEIQLRRVETSDRH